MNFYLFSYEIFYPSYEPSLSLVLVYKICLQISICLLQDPENGKTVCSSFSYFSGTSCFGSGLSLGLWATWCCSKPSYLVSMVLTRWPFASGAFDDSGYFGASYKASKTFCIPASYCWWSPSMNRSYMSYSTSMTSTSSFASWS